LFCVREVSSKTRIETRRSLLSICKKSNLSKLEHLT
jgi:hypothetical protein